MASEGDGNEAQAHSGLTRFYLEQHTEAMRRDDARRRGRPNPPSPESDIHECESDFFTPPRVQRRPRITAEEQERSRREIDALWTEQSIGEKNKPWHERRTGPAGRGFGEPQSEASANHRGGVAVGPDRNGMTDAQWELHLEEIEDLKVGFGQQRKKAHDGLRQEESTIPKSTAQKSTVPKSTVPKSTVPRSTVPPRSNQPEPHFPPNFPPYHITRRMNEIAAYLANASYVVSLGGPPLGDIKYGVIVVPVGEESLLFGARPDNIFTRDFLEAIEDAKYAHDANDAHSVDTRMHGMERDSSEFLRRRFRDDFRERPVESHRNVEAEELGRGEMGRVPEDADTSSMNKDKEEGVIGPTVEGGARDEEMAELGWFGAEKAEPIAARGSTRATRGSTPAPARTRTHRGEILAAAPAPAPRAGARKPQGVTKSRSSTQRRGDGITGTGTGAGTGVSPPKKPKVRKKQTGGI